MASHTRGHTHTNLLKRYPKEAEKEALGNMFINIGYKNRHTRLLQKGVMPNLKL